MAKKIKNYTEAELLKMFSLSRHIKTQTALMQDWLAIEIPVFNAVEEDRFMKILLNPYKAGTKRI